ncbi:MAG: hypothetical protein K8W52_17170 [Deltaproteobacteria bacterium]|nr:hypothetical protein [Deltaproteobacteria bacterium]
MRASSIATALATSALAGCTAHLSAGPHVRNDGNTGSTVAASVAFGKPVGDYRLLAIGGTLMVITDEAIRGGGGGNVDYVDAGGVLPFRATVRVGALTREGTTAPDGSTTTYPTRLAVGGAFAVYPFHNNFRALPDHSDDPVDTKWQTKPDDDMLSDMLRKPHDSDDDGSMPIIYGLGLEVAVDALPTTAPSDPRELFVSLSLVGELSLVKGPALR